MIVQTEVSVLFDTLEFQTLNRVEPSIRVGFPTDEIENAVRDSFTVGGRQRVEAAKRQWAGRHLAGVCSRRDVFDANYIHDAWDELAHLIDVLAEQSTREYWERELRPRASNRAERAEREGAVGAVGLVAPGTDVCGMLAETRERMLHIADEAVPLLRRAVEAVGPRTEKMSARALIDAASDEAVTA